MALGSRWCPSCKDPEWVVERDLRERERFIVRLGQESVPGGCGRQADERRLGMQVAEHDRLLQCRHRRLQRAHDLEAVVVAAAVAVAVDGQEDARLDLREAVDDAPNPEVGRTARPDRTEAGAGVEPDDGLHDVREVGDHAVAAADARGAQRRRDPRGRGFELRPARLDERPELGGVAHRDLIAVAAPKTRPHS